MGKIDDERLHSIVDVAVDGMPAVARAAHRRIVESGSAHVVVVLRDHAAVRVSRDANTAGTMRQRQNLVDSIPTSIGFMLPWSLGPVVEVDELSAVATELIPGAPCPAGAGDPHELQRLLTQVASIPPGPVESFLTEPLAFCGGPDWFQIQVEEVIPRLDREVQGRAVDVVTALAELKPQREVFSHGDLGGHNVFWEGDRVAGVLDWDLASWSDRSTDLACIGVWNGWDKLPLIASSSEVCRAAIRRNTFRLQQVAFHLISGRSSEEIDQAVVRANTWLREQL